MLPGLGAYPGKGLYVAEDDLDLPHVVEGLLRDILSGRYAYIHFGTPCTTWANLAKCNGGTRTRALPQGTDVGKRGVKEAHANRQVDSVVRLCLALARSGALWSVENLAESCMWFYCEMLRLRTLQGFCEVRFGQCQFGLRLLGVEGFCRKRTTMWANFNISSLQRTCSGVTPTHKQAHAQGSVRYKNNESRCLPLRAHIPSSFAATSKTAFTWHFGFT